MKSNLRKTLSERSEFRREMTARQVLALNSILAGDSFRDAALKAGVDERTIRRWRRDDPNFESTLRRSVMERREEVCTRATIAAGKALETILAIASDQSDPRSLRAAGQLLQLARIATPQNLRVSVDEVRHEQLEAYL